MGKKALGNLKITGKKVLRYQYDPNYIDPNTGILGFKLISVNKN